MRHSGRLLCVVSAWRSGYALSGWSPVHRAAISRLYAKLSGQCRQLTTYLLERWWDVGELAHILQCAVHQQLDARLRMTDEASCVSTAVDIYRIRQTDRIKHTPIALESTGGPGAVTYCSSCMHRAQRQLSWICLASEQRACFAASMTARPWAISLSASPPAPLWKSVFRNTPVAPSSACGPYLSSVQR